MAKDEGRAFICQRLLPGTDLKLALEAVAARLRAGVVVSLVGSLERACLRMAGAEAAIDLAGPCEIVSGTGTLSQDGVHVHIAVAGKTGTTIGGHLMHGCLVGTTVEMVVADLSADWSFRRSPDGATGCAELRVEAAGPGEP